jgi:hypothetical protein
MLLTVLETCRGLQKFTLVDDRPGNDKAGIEYTISVTSPQTIRIEYNNKGQTTLQPELSWKDAFSRSSEIGEFVTTYRVVEDNLTTWLFPLEGVEWLLSPKCLTISTSSRICTFLIAFPGSEASFNESHYIFHALLDFEGDAIKEVQLFPTSREGSNKKFKLSSSMQDTETLSALFKTVDHCLGDPIKKLDRSFPLWLRVRTTHPIPFTVRSWFMYLECGGKITEKLDWARSFGTGDMECQDYPDLADVPDETLVKCKVVGVFKTPQNSLLSTVLLEELSQDPLVNSTSDDKAMNVHVPPQKSALKRRLITASLVLSVLLIIIGSITAWDRRERKEFEKNLQLAQSSGQDITLDNTSRLYLYEPDVTHYEEGNMTFGPNRLVINDYEV